MHYTSNNLDFLDSVINHNKNGYLLLTNDNLDFKITRISQGLNHIFKDKENKIGKSISCIPEILEILVSNQNIAQFEYNHLQIQNHELNTFFFNISIQKKTDETFIYLEDITEDHKIKSIDKSIYKIIKKNNELRDQPEELIELCFNELHFHLGIDFLVLNINENNKERLMFYEFSKPFKAFRPLIDEQGFSMSLGNHSFVHYEKYTTYKNIKIELNQKDIDFDLMLQAPISFKGNKLGSIWMVWKNKKSNAFNKLESNLLETVVQQFKILSERIALNQELYSKKEHFKSLIHQSHDIIATVNKRGEITYISPSVFKSVGFKDIDLIGNSIIQYVNQSEFIHLHGKMIRALKYDGIFQDVIGIKSKSGFIKKFFFTIKKANKLSQLNDFIINAKDITTEHKSQTELLLSTKTSMLIQKLEKKGLNFNNMVSVMQKFVVKAEKEFQLPFLAVTITKNNGENWDHITSKSHVPNINIKRTKHYSTEEYNPELIKDKDQVWILNQYPTKLYLNKLYYEIPIYNQNVLNGIFHFTIGVNNENRNLILKFIKDLAIQIGKAINLITTNEALIKKEYLNKAIIGSIPNLILIINEDGRIENFHHAPQNDYRVDPDLLLHKNAFEIIQHKNINSEKEAILKCLKNKERVVSNFTFDDKLIEALYSFFAPNKVVAIYKDVTIQKNRETLELKKIMKALDIERNRFSRELHDGIGQILTAVRMNIEALKYNYEQIPEAAQQVDFINNLLNQAIAETRNIVFNLHPRTLYDLGLKNALSEVAQMLNNESLDLDLKIKFTSLASKRFNEDLELGAFRLCQELLNNGIKYSQASHMELNINSDEKYININYFDNGIGFNPEDELKIKSNGLVNMKNRISSLNGRMTLKTQPGEGCLCKIKLPIKSSELMIDEVFPQKITSTF